ncbi:hypothetical protein, partial [Mycobacterium intracellulare]
MSTNESAPEPDGHRQPKLATVWPGNPYALGDSYDGAENEFSQFSEIAEKVELC